MAGGEERESGVTAEAWETIQMGIGMVALCFTIWVVWGRD